MDYVNENVRGEIREDVFRLEKDLKNRVESQSFDSACFSNSSASMGGSVDIEEKSSSPSFNSEVPKSDLEVIPEASDSGEYICPTESTQESIGSYSGEQKQQQKHVEDDDDEGFFTQSDFDDLCNQDEDGDSILHMAIINGDSKLVEYYIINVKLLSCTHLLDLQNNLYQTPLHLAVITKQYDIISLLVRNGACVDIRDNNGNTPLHIACKEEDIKCVKMLLGAKNISKSLPQRNYDGFTSLHLAVLNKPYPIVNLLLCAGADINAQDGKSGRTILHYAVEAKNVILVTQLLKYPELNINALTFAGMSSYYLAQDQHNELMKNVLRGNGASLVYPDSTSDESEEDDDDEMLQCEDYCMDYQPS
ncbi:NF-kappa-B inhibitor cactus-like [Argonauta hians]